MGTPASGWPATHAAVRKYSGVDSAVRRPIRALVGRITSPEPPMNEHELLSEALNGPIRPSGPLFSTSRAPEILNCGARLVELLAVHAKS